MDRASTPHRSFPLLCLRPHLVFRPRSLIFFRCNLVVHRRWTGLDRRSRNVRDATLYIRRYNTPPPPLLMLPTMAAAAAAAADPSRHRGCCCRSRHKRETRIGNSVYHRINNFAHVRTPALIHVGGKWNWWRLWKLQREARKTCLSGNRDCVNKRRAEG